MGKTLLFVLAFGASLWAITPAKTTARKATAVAPRKKPVVAKKTQQQARTRIVRRRTVAVVSPSRLLMARYVQPDLSTFPEMSPPLPDMVDSELHDSFFAARVGRRVHQAIDIMRPEGTPLYACVDGFIEKLNTSALGGIAIYLADADGRHRFYYAHLSAYADGLAESMPVLRGQLIGYVGSTGNARFTGPHLHFQIMRDSTNVNPFPVLRGIVGGAIPIHPVTPAPVLEEMHKAIETVASVAGKATEPPMAAPSIARSSMPLVIPNYSVAGGR